MSLFWKECHSWYHVEHNEEVILFRHRLTGSLRRMWLSYPKVERAENGEVTTWGYL